MWRIFTWLAVALLLAAGPPGVRADYALFTDFNATNPNVTSPYAQVTITNIASNELQFALTDYGTNSATFRDFGFNLNGILFSDITSATVNGYTSSLIQNHNFSAYGKFDVTVDPGTPNPSKQSPETIDITFDKNVTPSNVEALNGDNHYFAAEYFPTGNTGFIASDNITVGTPAPPGLVLAMSGCGALGLFYLVRRKKVIALT